MIRNRYKVIDNKKSYVKNVNKLQDHHSLLICFC